MLGYTSVSFAHICRLCATYKPEGQINVFEANGKKLELQEKIQRLLSVKITHEDVLPKVVCNNCLKKIEEFATFCNRCILSEGMLSTYYENAKSTEEFSKTGKVYIKTININNTNDLSTTNHAPQDNIDYTNCNSSMHLSMTPNTNISETFTQNNNPIDVEMVKLETPTINEQIKTKPTIQIKQMNIIKVKTNPTNTLNTLEPIDNAINTQSNSNTLREPGLQESVIGVNPQKKYSCQQCGKCFKRREVLYQHKKHHRGERRFKCEVCCKAFLRKEHLDRHELSHTGQKRFVCSMCKKTFARKDNLYKHVKIHEKANFFYCTICQKRFVLEYYFHAHMRGMHGINTKVKQEDIRNGADDDTKELTVANIFSEMTDDYYDNERLNVS